MKKFFHFAALALVASALMVACKSGGEKTEEAPKANDSAVEDTTVIESAAMVQDTVIEEAPVATTKAENKNEFKATTEQPTKDAKENASSRMAKRSAESQNLSESKPAQDAPAIDQKQNAQNRMKARAK